MQIHEKYNLTPFVADFGFCQDKNGREQVVAIVKATFFFSDTGKLTIPESKEDMLPVFKMDEYYDKPDNSSIKYPSDIFFQKQGTDVIINGHAYSQGLKRSEAGFKLNALEKKIIVFGERKWRKRVGIKFFEGPTHFSQIPLKFENAFGGAFENSDGDMVRFPENPVGTGFTNFFIDGLTLPNLEYPKTLINSLKSKPKPAGFGAIAPGWNQRYSLAGTFDEKWMATRRPLLPVDFNDKYYNVAPDDQIYFPKLKGGEKLFLINIHRSKSLIPIEIPKLNFITSFHIKERIVEEPMVADTLLIEPDLNRIAISFRSSTFIGLDIKFLKTIHFQVAG